jgi:hypothetical protein
MSVYLPPDAVNATVVQNGVYHPYYASPSTRRMGANAPFAGISVTPPQGGSPYVFAVYRTFAAFTIPAGAVPVSAQLSGYTAALDNFWPTPPPRLVAFPGSYPWSDVVLPFGATSPPWNGNFVLDFPQSIVSQWAAPTAAKPISICITTEAEADQVHPPVPGQGSGVWYQGYSLGNLALHLYAQLIVEIADTLQATDAVDPHLLATYAIADTIHASDALTTARTHSSTVDDRAGAGDMVHMVRTLTIADTIGLSDYATTPTPEIALDLVSIPVSMPDRRVTLRRL